MKFLIKWQCGDLIGFDVFTKVEWTEICMFAQDYFEDHGALGVYYGNALSYFENYEDWKSCAEVEEISASQELALMELSLLNYGFSGDFRGNV